MNEYAKQSRLRGVDATFISRVLRHKKSFYVKIAFTDNLNKTRYIVSRFRSNYHIQVFKEGLPGVVLYTKELNE